MHMKAFLILSLFTGSAAAPDPSSDYRLVNPRAIELFEKDERLMRWALEFFDLDRDGRLSIREADLAARQFKLIADGNRDGQVTPAEYRAAVEFIVARWAVR
jgi:hypothetical protein